MSEHASGDAKELPSIKKLRRIPGNCEGSSEITSNQHSSTFFTGTDTCYGTWHIQSGNGALGAVVSKIVILIEPPELPIFPATSMNLAVKVLAPSAPPLPGPTVKVIGA